MRNFPPAAEAVYFDKAHVAHIAEYDERNRLAMIDARAREALRSRPRLSARFGR